jgi:pantothenate synthetase
MYYRKNEKKNQREKMSQEMNAIHNEIKEEEKNKDNIRKIRQELNHKGDRIKEISIMCDRHRTKIKIIEKQAIDVEALKEKCHKENKVLFIYLKYLS